MTRPPVAAGMGTESVGTAPGEIGVVAILVNPCGGKLQSATKESVENVIFGDHEGSYKSIIKECGRNDVTLKGLVVGPIEVCPQGANTYYITKAVQDGMQVVNSAAWAEHRHKVMILPDEWLSAIGQGTVGRGNVWIQESYHQHPVMYIHEIGHNWHLHHSGNLYGAEYGDTSSAMGECCHTRCFHFLHSWQLGWAEFQQTLSINDITNDEAMPILLNVPDLGLHKTSGIKITTTQGFHITLSYRGHTGFDKYLQDYYRDQIQVHKWDGTLREDAKVTRLVTSAEAGETVFVDAVWPAFKVTVLNMTAEKSAYVVVCAENSGGNKFKPCRYENAVSPPAPAPPPPWLYSYTSYIAGNQDSVESSEPMTGLGCKGDFCKEVRTMHWTNVKAAERFPEWQDITDDVGITECPANRAVTQIRCKDATCARLQLKCAVLLGGILQRTGIAHTSPWFPPELNQQSDRFCAEGHVLTGLSVGVGKRQLICRKFVPNGNCVPYCSTVGLECGDDGCEGSCGTCTGQDQQCCFGKCQDDSTECTQIQFVGGSALQSMSRVLGAVSILTVVAIVD